MVICQNATMTRMVDVRPRDSDVVLLVMGAMVLWRGRPKTKSTRRIVLVDGRGRSPRRMGVGEMPLLCWACGGDAEDHDDWWFDPNGHPLLVRPRDVPARPAKEEP